MAIFREDKERTTVLILNHWFGFVCIRNSGVSAAMIVCERLVLRGRDNGDEISIDQFRRNVELFRMAVLRSCLCQLVNQVWDREAGIRS